MNNLPPRVASFRVVKVEPSNTFPLTNKLALSDTSCPTNNRLLSDTSPRTLSRILMDASEAMLLIERGVPFTKMKPEFTYKFPPSEASFITDKYAFA